MSYSSDPSAFFDLYLSNLSLRSSKQDITEAEVYGSRVAFQAIRQYEKLPLLSILDTNYGNPVNLYTPTLPLSPTTPTVH